MEANVQKVTELKKKKYVSVRERDGLARIRDIAAVFGIPEATVRRGCRYCGATAHPSLAKTDIWWPKEDARNSFQNEFDADDTVIREWNIDKAKCLKFVNELLNDSKKRIVFKCEEHSIFGWAYRFIGVFAVDVEASRKEGKAVWRRKLETDKIML